MSEPVEMTPDGLIEAATKTLRVIEEHGETIAAGLDPEHGLLVLISMLASASATASLAAAMLLKERAP